MTLYQRLVQRGVVRPRPRAPSRCTVCRLRGHNWQRCQVRARLAMLRIPAYRRGGK